MKNKEGARVQGKRVVSVHAKPCFHYTAYHAFCLKFFLGRGLQVHGLLLRGSEEQILQPFSQAHLHKLLTYRLHGGKWVSLDDE